VNWLNQKLALLNKHPKEPSGAYFEAIATQHLKQNKVSILKNNYHSRYGEIDIIGLEKDILIFVEVKARNEDALTSPEEAVNYSKQQKIIKTAKRFLCQNPSYQTWTCRFDVISILFTKDSHQIKWLKNAFQLS
jgi:putative endonuclease